MMSVASICVHVSDQPPCHGKDTLGFVHARIKYTCVIKTAMLGMETFNRFVLRDLLLICGNRKELRQMK